mmetsp:Transcript_31656/g.61215  ORF Transcript_31656/g.61215 Transcript_31656/m.61215 type:complete len:367 (+) Transcript_31656:457-1557(+)
MVALLVQFDVILEHVLGVRDLKVVVVRPIGVTVLLHVLHEPPLQPGRELAVLDAFFLVFLHLDDVLHGVRLQLKQLREPGDGEASLVLVVELPENLLGGPAQPQRVGLDLHGGLVGIEVVFVLALAAAGYDGFHRGERVDVVLTQAGEPVLDAELVELVVLRLRGEGVQGLLRSRRDVLPQTRVRGAILGEALHVVAVLLERDGLGALAELLHHRLFVIRLFVPTGLLHSRSELVVESTLVVRLVPIQLLDVLVEVQVELLARLGVSDRHVRAAHEHVDLVLDRPLVGLLLVDLVLASLLELGCEVGVGVEVVALGPLGQEPAREVSIRKRPRVRDDGIEDLVGDVQVVRGQRIGIVLVVVIRALL